MLVAVLVIALALHAALPACGPLFEPDFADLTQSTFGILCRY